ncbi:16S rRNA (adenine(1518)-N(6)/adenine(1519)-N(6))-dimethyltransferase RsmA [Blattabacterium cuenoti]|uniref:16S rRNA (adenine(1518)-N(6)/adenine(1519)-N(6))- dimethyltransferase RsmA n=1 Tax=Blattabacterium cuenoti TaxID=1653831 RepID=UPI00163C77E1|nr:16S rRNA (adenine(1518)-N(6)/adenine(1519)-N(6))-dimethyltransferase RsmA [Blattabacterium cuenoti]
MYNSFFIRKSDQFFLKDNDIAKKIVNSLSFQNYNSVVEVGPGLGILTQNLLKCVASNHLFLIESDKDLIHFLMKFFPISKNRIIHNTFLKWNPDQIFLKNFAIIGNFPYSISSPILFHILKYSRYIPECIGMFQKEFAEKITSHKGGNRYGRLSVLIQIFYEVKYLFNVESSFFYPKPNVCSAVISLKRKKKVFTPVYQQLLFKCVQMAFHQRRKKLKNSLKLWNHLSKFHEISFLDKRAEELSAKDFLKLTKEIEIRK